MTDRKMLELAAKAAGIEFNDKRSSTGGIALYCALNGWWNPLENDSHAFRLAVKLKIIVTFADAGGGPYVCAGQRLGPFSRERLPVKIFALEEELAATRRAISMAAAEIGRGME